MGKISFDKYYTPPTVARYCIDKVKEVIGEENITEWFEPSAGSGTFSNQIKDCEAYDLYPQNDNVKQADFTELGLQYKKGRIFIGNPPFGGGGGVLLKKFYNKCVASGDYIAFILPSSFHNNYNSFNKFEIVHSNLFETDYTNEKLKTAFVIYKKSETQDKFKNIDYNIPFLEFTHYTRSNAKDFKPKPINKDYDVCYVDFGVVMTPSTPYKHSSTRTIKIHNEKYKDEIIKCIKWSFKHNKTTKFLNTNISTANITTDKVCRLLRACIPELDLEFPIKNNEQ
jgi:hypothetical protein